MVLHRDYPASQFTNEILVQTLIALIVWLIWLYFVGLTDGMAIVVEHMGVVLTMLFGSFIAGSTSLGGGAVAFPVFTKILAIDSNTALIFSLAIQSIGMTAASLFIFASRIPVCFRVICYSFVFGGLGLLTSFFMVRQHLAGADIKYLFSCFSLIVGVSLLWSQTRKNSQKSDNPAHPLLISIGSFSGGILSGIIGTGIDFILFTLMIFCWRYDFKRAIATSVVVMAGNAMVGFMAILFFTNDFTGPVVSYWLAAVPVVVVGAPLGALACRYIPKNFMVAFLLALVLLDISSTIAILGLRTDFIVVMVLLMAAMLLLNYVAKKTDKYLNIKGK